MTDYSNQQSYVFLLVGSPSSASEQRHSLLRDRFTKNVRSATTAANNHHLHQIGLIFVSASLIPSIVHRS
ncbi:hypothetical protein L2E82_30736 [Cichorium intybus]|uniref:Uncharacterized protein n=1 Tax=Cichorium intybus TaxID=13427 RepID=A0ACB9D1I1_CICIN|nr:hypothetical protein L2E82_30736 [Cichorium intybus]